MTHPPVLPVDEQLTAVWPEVAAADTRMGDVDECVGRVVQRSVRYVFDANITGAVVDRGSHGCLLEID